MEREEYKLLRALVAARMQNLGISQRELGVSLGMSTSYVNKLLNGKRTIELTELIDLCKELDLDTVKVVESILPPTE